MAICYFYCSPVSSVHISWPVSTPATQADFRALRGLRKCGLALGWEMGPWLLSREWAGENAHLREPAVASIWLLELKLAHWNFDKLVGDKSNGLIYKMRLK